MRRLLLVASVAAYGFFAAEGYLARAEMDGLKERLRIESRAHRSYQAKIRTLWEYCEPERNGTPDYQKPIFKGKRSLNFTPVSSGSEENQAFWRYTASGSIQLGTVSADAWRQFDLGKSYYVDFLPAD